MQIALTGATGFIGRRLCIALARNNHRVRVLARNRETAARSLDPRTEILGGDLDSPAALRDLVRGCDAVIHLAGTVRGASWRDFETVNVSGTAQLLRAMDAASPQAPLLFFSSLAAREPDLSHYARSKYLAEELLRAASGSRPCLILRPPAVYGPGDREMLPVFRFMAKTGLAPAAGAASARLSLLFVDDLDTLVSAWLDAAGDITGTFALHDGHEGGYGWSEIAAIVSALAGRPVRVWEIPRLPLDLLARANSALAKRLAYQPMLTPEKLRELRHPDWACSNEGITAALGWRPKVELDAGLRQTPGWSLSGQRNNIER
ncbi:MAG: NAD(P)-dependent oxidoreductase [Pseudomonadales bacterium]|nr:NAD(P)-dependent oxidoreductase [Pseudomonadales bacterium]